MKPEIQCETHSKTILEKINIYANIHKNRHNTQYASTIYTRHNKNQF